MNVMKIMDYDILKIPGGTLKWDGKALVNTDQPTPRNIQRERRPQILGSQKRLSSKSKMDGWMVN
jgi:hypothetical protein